MAAFHQASKLGKRGDLTPTLRDRARFPAAAPLTAANPAQSVALQPMAIEGWNGPLTLAGRADRFYRPLVAVKWTRYGWWSADGWELTVTRIL